MDELREINRLNDDWDALVRGDTREVDPDLTRDVMALREATVPPGPSAEFADRLWRDLERGRAMPARPRHWPIPRLAIAAVLALVLIGGALAIALRDDRAPAPGQLAVATETPMVATSPVETPAPAGPTATVPTAETPRTAFATAPAQTPTPDPNATVPTGPTPPIQAGGGPVYETLNQLVNASDVIVLGRVTEETATTAEGGTFRVLQIERLVRGDGGETLHLVDYGEYLPGETILLFGQRTSVDLPDAVIPIGTGVVPVVDGIVTDYGDGRGWPIAGQYAGQPVEALIAAIEAIPNLQPQIEALATRYGWELLDRQSLWPLQLPAPVDQDSGPILPFAPFSWDAANAASARVGLDFASLAGQEAELIVFFAERDPREQGIQPVWFAALVHDQRVAGAWVTVGGAGRPFGLDERDAALAEPAYVPTPAPTPTPVVPVGATVNPAQLYGLANTDTFNFCWPYCGTDGQPMALRDALVAALDAELSIQPLETHPTPTESRDLVEADGSFVWLVFGYLTPGWPAESFGYDRDAGLVLLPRQAGWVAAPPALVEIMAGIEPPPPPTKPIP